ncbi:MAG: hypothetical protein AAGJ52_09655, partial [Pseudomonadota bacterium]
MHRMIRISMMFCLLFCAKASFAQALSCDASPFGDGMVLLPDREVLVGVVGRNQSGSGEIFRYSDDGQSIPNDGLVGQANIAELTSTLIDLNGDGRQETAYAGINGSGQPFVRIVDEFASPIDSWVQQGTGSNLRIAAVSYFDGQDAKQELFIAFDIGQDQIQVRGFSGNNSGGLVASDGSSEINLIRTVGGAVSFDLAAADFLLEGRDQLALV